MYEMFIFRATRSQPFSVSLTLAMKKGIHMQQMKISINSLNVTNYGDNLMIIKCFACKNAAAKKRHKNNLMEFCLLMEYAMRQAHLKLISSHFIAYHTTTLDSLTMFIFTHSRDYLGYLAGCL